MIINITADMTEEEIRKKLSELKPKKPFDPAKYAGKVKWNEDPIAYQKRLRDEWN